MKVKRIRTTAPEIFKTTKNMKPIYVKYVFSPKTHASVRPNDILVKSHWKWQCYVQKYGISSPKISNCKRVLGNSRNILILGSDLYANVISAFRHNSFKWCSKQWKRLSSGFFSCKYGGWWNKMPLTKMIFSVFVLPVLVTGFAKGFIFINMFMKSLITDTGYRVTWQIKVLVLNFFKKLINFYC